MGELVAPERRSVASAEGLSEHELSARFDDPANRRDPERPNVVGARAHRERGEPERAQHEEAGAAV